MTWLLALGGSIESWHWAPLARWPLVIWLAAAAPALALIGVVRKDDRAHPGPAPLPSPSIVDILVALGAIVCCALHPWLLLAWALVVFGPGLLENPAPDGWLRLALLALAASLAADPSLPWWSPDFYWDQLGEPPPWWGALASSWLAAALTSPAGLAISAALLAVTARCDLRTASAHKLVLAVGLVLAYGRWRYLGSYVEAG